jgi:acyl-CoA synthetase (NDP forming)
MGQRPEGRTRQDLSPLLKARSVAVVGISHPDRFGGMVFRNLKTFGYAGSIHGVNPRYETLYNRPCYDSLANLPERPDCALLALPNERLLAGLEEVGACGIPAAVIFASAYSDAEGEDSLLSGLRAIAEDKGIVLCGPNGMGFVSLGNRLAVTGYATDAGTRTGGISLITHSGSIWDAFLQNQRDLRFNYIISSGSEIVTTVADYMEFCLEDPTTKAIGLFLETVRDPATFEAALKRAAERDIPVVVLKTGRSRRGAELARAHSGALAGEDAAYDALFSRYGVSRCRSSDEMMDTLELFSSGMRPKTRFVSAIHDSGGERALLVDLAQATGVEFTPINEGTTARLSKVLESGLDPINPLDAWGTGNDAESIYEECLLALDDDPQTGLTLFSCDLYPLDDVDSFYPKIAEATLQRLKKPLAWMVHLSSGTSLAQMARLRSLGIPVLMGTETGLRALAHLLNYSEYQREGDSREGEIRALVRRFDGQSPGNLEALRLELQSAGRALDEYASKKFLAAYGIETTREIRAEGEGEVRRAGAEIGYPLVLKTAAGGLHKTELDGIRLGISNAEELALAYRDFESRLGTSVLVQEYLPEGPELLLGLVHDAQFGPMLSLGIGGIFVEVLKDTRMLALPTRAEEIRKALLGLRGASLFQGVRGAAAADLEAAVEAALNLSRLARDLGDGIEELDINPLRVLEDRAVALDALIIPRGEPGEARSP